MEELQHNHFETPKIKAWQIFQVTQDWIYKVINHSFIENHSIETEKEKIPIVPWVLMLESLFDYFWLDLLNQPYDAKFNNFLKPEDIINFYSSQNEYWIEKKWQNVITLKKLSNPFKPDLNECLKEKSKHTNNFISTQNNWQLFQKDNFSLINKVYSYHLDKTLLQQQDSFIWFYNNIISNPFLLLEFAAQAASLMATNFLKEKIITLKSIQFEFKNLPDNNLTPKVRWKISNFTKKEASIEFEVYQESKWKKTIICEWKLEWNIISKKLLAKLIKN